MSSRSVVTVTTGVSGSGKTYYRCAVFLVDEWLPNHSGVLITNYPINLDNLVRDYGEGVEDRLELIPPEVLREWREGRSGPWDYLRDRDISGCHIAIDEIHNYCPKTADNKLRKKWMQFIGELRHQGATIEFLTQNEAKCAKEILAEAEIRYEIINGENIRCPVLGYRMGDLYQFRAKALGRYLCPSYCIEYTQNQGGWVEINRSVFYRLPKYFEYYDSFSAPEHGQALGHKSEPMPWEIYSWPRLFIWFVMEYPFRIGFQVSAVAIFIWAFFLGGISGCSQKYLKAIGAIKDDAPKNVRIEDKKSSDSPSVSDSSVRSSPSPSSYRVVRKESWVIVSPSYVKMRDGREYWAGDAFYGSVIGGFDVRSRMCYLEDGFFFPVEWFSDMEVY